MTVSASAHKRVRPSYESSPVSYRITRAIIVLVMHLLYRYRATGREKMPKAGPTIIAVNHIHLFDVGVVVTAIRRRIYTLAAAKWRDNRLVNAFMRIAGTIYVRRGQVDRQALKDCLQALRKGHALAIAPEGTRSRGKGLQRAKPGLVYLASRTKAIVVPVAFWGVERLSDWKRLRRPTCRLVIGNPFRLPALEKGASTERMQQLADQVMVRIGSLLPESYRGVYADQIAAYQNGQADELLPAG